MYNNDLGTRVLLDPMTLIDGADHVDTRLLCNADICFEHMLQFSNILNRNAISQIRTLTRIATSVDFSSKSYETFRVP